MHDGPGGPGPVDEAADALARGGADERADLGGRIGGVADDERGRPSGEAVEQLLGDVGLDEDAGTSGAVLATGQERGLGDRVEQPLGLGRAGPVESIGEHHLRALAAHLQRDPLEVAVGGGVQDGPSRRGGPREGQRIDVGVRGQRRPRHRAGPREHGEHAVGNPGAEREFGQPQRRPGRGVGGFQQQAVARREGRPDLPRRHRQRVVPRQDGRTDADGFQQGHGQRVCRPALGAAGDGGGELVRGVGEPPQRLHRPRQVVLPHLRHRPAGLPGVQRGEFVGGVLDEVGEPAQHGGAFAHRPLRPGPGREHPAGPGHGRVDPGRVVDGDVLHHRARRRVDEGHGLFRGRRHRGHGASSRRPSTRTTSPRSTSSSRYSCMPVHPCRGRTP